MRLKKIVALMLLVALMTVGIAIAPVEAQAASKTTSIYVVKVDGARVRAGSNLQKIVTSLKKGAHVVYMGKTKGSMMYVRTSDGKKGYVYKRYLGAYGAAPAKNIYATKARTQVYKRASSSSKRVTKLAKGTTVIVYETKGSWAYIRTLSGTGGYVKKSSLKKG